MPKIRNPITVTMNNSQFTTNPSVTVSATGNVAWTDSNILSYKWSKVSGPGTVTFASPYSATTNVSSSTSGDYVLKCQVTDINGTKDDDTFNVHINAAPTLGFNTAAVLARDSTASASLRELSGTVTINEPGSTISSYNWTYISGPTSGNPSNTSNYKALLNSAVTGAGASGNYVYRFSVTDSNGITVTSDLSVKVNTAPVLDLGAIGLKEIGGTFSRTASVTNTDNTSLTYAWTWASGPNQPTISGANTATASFSPTSYTYFPGHASYNPYKLRCTVTDFDGLADVKDLEVKAGNLPTISDILAEKQDPNDLDNIYAIGETAPTLTAVAFANDPDKTLTYNWVQPTNATLTDTGFINTRDFSTSIAANYTVNLTVTDTLGLTSSNANIVIAAGNRPTFNSFTPDPAAITESYGLPANVADVDTMTGMTYNWSWVSGPNQPALSNTTSPTVNFTPTTYTESPVNRYTLKCVVRDNIGLYKEKNFEVKAGNRPTISSVVASKQNASDASNVFALGEAAVTLTATGNSNDSGESITYAWTQPANTTVTPSGGTNTTATFSAATIGAKTVNVTATDALGLTTTSPTSIVVTAGTRPSFDSHTINPAPIGEGAYSISAGASDPDAGSSINYSWAWVSGPDQPTLSNSTTATASFTPTTYTENPVNRYIVKCDITDNIGLFNTKNFTVKAGNRPTISSVVASKQDTNDLANAFAIGEAATTLTVTGSSNDSGEGLIYTWVQPANTTVTPSGGANTTASFTTSTVADHSVGVYATDDLGFVSTTSNILIKASNRPAFDSHTINPADIGLGAYSISAGATDSDAGATFTYNWSWVSGPDQPTIVNNTAATASFTPTTYTESPLNRYTLKCKIWDNSGLYKEKNFAVKAGHKPTSTVATSPASRALTTETLSLVGTANDSDSDISTTLWEHVEGWIPVHQPSNLTTTIGVGDNPGTHNFRFTVTDGLGLTEIKTLPFTVSRPSFYLQTPSNSFKPTYGVDNNTETIGWLGLSNINSGYGKPLLLVASKNHLYANADPSKMYAWNPSSLVWEQMGADGPAMRYLCMTRSDVNQTGNIYTYHHEGPSDHDTTEFYGDFFTPSNSIWSSPNITRPSVGNIKSATYDATLNRVILVANNDSGGYEGSLEYAFPTYASSGVTTLPVLTSTQNLAYNPNTQKTYLYNGSATYRYDGLQGGIAVWTNLAPSVSPPNRSGHAMIYSPAYQNIIIFGGMNAAGTAYLNDMWCYNAASNYWYQITLGAAPTARYGSVMAEENNEIYIFGGVTGSPASQTKDNNLWRGIRP